MTDSTTGGRVGRGFRNRLPLPPLPLFLLQPVLGRVVRRVAAENPGMFNRLGPHRQAVYLIDPTNMPFRLLLRPDPENLMLRAISNRGMPVHTARIAGKFLDLLRLMDTDADGDALFFSRELEVTGNTEAVVCLRNALDDVDGSVAEAVADMFGPPGRAALRGLRKVGERRV
jgi:O2-independent ubiquinone biosynthesis accessory factor UbiT